MKRFEELGFKPDDIKRELLLHGNDEEKTLDALTAKSWGHGIDTRDISGFINGASTNRMQACCHAPDHQCNFGISGCCLKDV